jgi:hypothetical protein
VSFTDVDATKSGDSFFYLVGAENAGGRSGEEPNP